MPTTNSLRPFAEQVEKMKPNDVHIWSNRVVDRALIECRELMEEALCGLKASPPTKTDLAIIKAGKKKLVEIAVQLNINQTMIDAEISTLNNPYVTAKTAARQSHPETGEAGKEITRSITNLYAHCQALATLINNAIVPDLRKKQPESNIAAAAKPAAPSKPKPALVQKLEPGDTGDLTAAALEAQGDLPLPDDEDFNFDDFSVIDTDDDRGEHGDSASVR